MVGLGGAVPRQALPARPHAQLAAEPAPAAPVPDDRRLREKTLRLVARYADACNIFAGPDAAASSTCSGALRRGNKAGVTYPLPGTHSWATTATVTYGYDNADLLTGVTDFNGHTITITPTANGLPGSETLGSSGDTITATYDNTDTPSALALKDASTTLQSFTYADSPAGTILSETDTPSSPRWPQRPGTVPRSPPPTATARPP